MTKIKSYDVSCKKCPRLAKHLKQVRKEYPDYHARPVAPFGDEKPGLLIVGLAPGMHGANATGRPFTGDHAGILLYQTLYDYGFSNQPTAEACDDGLKLKKCRITNAVKCLPPANKPIGAEISTCNSYLSNELSEIKGRLVILALGGIAHNAVLKAMKLRLKEFPFAHNALHELEPERYLLDSYHCSRYNTNTGRLTEPMFREVFEKAHNILSLTN